MGRRYTGKTCRLLTMLFLTLTFFFIEIVVGYVTNSMALVADSFHMLSDVLALLIGFFSVRVARRRTTKNTFGWVRAEVLGALVNAVFLVALCFSILVEALKRLILVEPIHNPKLLLIVGAVGLVVNLIGLFLFHDHGHSHGHSHNTRHPGNAESREHLGSFDKLNLSGAKYIEGAMAEDDDDLPYDQYTAIDGSSDSETTLPTSIAIGSGQTKLLKSEAAHQDVAPNHSIGNGNVSNLVDNDHFFVKTPKENGRIDTKIKDSKLQAKHRTKVSKNTSDKANSPISQSAGKEKESHKHGAHNHGSHMSMRGVFLHVLGDALGSVIVVVSALAIMYFKGSWRFYVDPCMSIMLVAIILGTTIPLLRESAFILLQTVPTHIEVEDLRRRLVDNIDGVLAVHEFHVWQLTGNRIIASAHIRCRNLIDYMKIAGKVKEFFHREGIHSTTIQPEFVEEFEEEERCLLQCRAPIICAPKTCCGKNGNKPNENGVGNQFVPTGNASGQPHIDAIDLENFIKIHQASAPHKATRLPPPPGTASRKIRNTPSANVTPKLSFNEGVPVTLINDELTKRLSTVSQGPSLNPFLSQADTLDLAKLTPASSSTVITFLPSGEDALSETPSVCKSL